VEFDRFDVYDCLVDAVVDDVNHANQDDARSDLMGRKQQQSLYLYEVKKLVSRLITLLILKTAVYP